MAALLFIWMTVIFLFSSQNGQLSSDVSEGFAARLFSIIYPSFHDMSDLEKLNFLETVMLTIRKLAHFTLYFVLGFLSSLLFVTIKKYGIYIKGIISWGFCVLYAVSDEIHQYFVPDRACAFRDVLIDSMGALLSVIIFVALIWSIKRFHKYKKFI